MKVKLKICGMRDPENIRQVANLSPDYIGFIFYNNSLRAVSNSLDLSGVPKTIKKVGVFVNEAVETVMTTVHRYNLDLVQLHGDETIADCERLKGEGIKIIKAFSIGDVVDFTSVVPYAAHCDYFLFDTKGKNYGGNGVVFDWKKLEAYDQRVPFFLSGGLSPHNVEGIRKLEGMNLHAIDVNSGVELEPGLKDVSKIKNVFSIINAMV